MIPIKNWCGGTKEEYETQHFGFGAQRMQIAVRQMVEQKITSSVRGMDSYLQDSLELNDTDKATLSRCCDNLIGLYCERAGPSLDIIDKEIGKILCIPSNTLLPADEAKSVQLSDKEYMELKEETAALRQLVERKALMEALLSAEEEELISVEKICDIAKKDMDTIDLLSKCSDKENVASLQTDLQNLCSNVPFMKESENLFDD